MTMPKMPKGYSAPLDMRPVSQLIAERQAKPDPLTAALARVKELETVIAEAATKIDRQVVASRSIALSEKPRSVKTVPTTMEIALSHFIDIAGDLRRARDLRAKKGEGAKTYEEFEARLSAVAKATWKSP